ncbi:hypothetical protein BGY98DRAFT_933883 [Russula aff. rugulosa BPL654]|nr:hypothetical protein BGY98DRAFT_933883 [Russula aff. rugulosa BPL654]
MAHLGFPPPSQLIMFPFTTIAVYAIAPQLVHALPVTENVSESTLSSRASRPSGLRAVANLCCDTDTSSPSPLFRPTRLSSACHAILGRQTPGNENPDLVSMGPSLYPAFGVSGNASPPSTISGPSASDCPTSTPAPDAASPVVLNLHLPGSCHNHWCQCVYFICAKSRLRVLCTGFDNVAHWSQGKSPLAGYTSLSAPTAHLAPLAGLNSNDAISRIQNPGATISSVVVSFHDLPHGLTQ